MKPPIPHASSTTPTAGSSAHSAPLLAAIPLAGVIALMTFASSAQAVTITMTGDDTGTASSYIAGTNWAGGATPTAGNDYVDNGRVLRTPATSTTSYTFAGDSLTLQGFVYNATSETNAGAMILKSTSTAGTTYTINSLTLDGGGINQAVGGGVAGYQSTSATLAGNIYLTGAGGYFYTTAANTGYTITVSTIVSAKIADSGASHGVLNVGNCSSASGITTDRLILTGTNTYSGATVIQNRSILQIGNGGTTGSIDNTTGISIVNSSAGLVFNRSDSGLVINQTISGVGTVTQAGTGMTTLTGSNTYTGTTSITAGALQLGDGSDDHNGTISNSSNVSAAANTTLIYNTAGSPVAYSGNISGAGAVIKNGTGTQTLAGTNSYTGKTTINTGILKFAKQTALYNNGTAAAWTTANIDVKAGATLAVDVGGTGGFTSANLDTLQGLGAANGGFESGSFLGIDTTNGDFSYLSNIADPSGNTLGLTKLGANKLTLGGANTYTGATTVSAGELDVTGSIAAGSSVSVTNGATLGGSGTIHGTTTVTNGAVNGDNLTLTGAVTFNGNNTLRGTVTASNGLTVASSGALNISGSTSSTVTVNSALLNGTGTTGSVVLVGGTLGGALHTGAITGAGTIAPGGSPGILTASSVTLGTGGESFKFELTAAAPTYNAGSNNSTNDVLRLTSGSPFSGTAANSSNVFDIFFGVSTLTEGMTFQGGIFADIGGDFSTSLSGGTFNYFVLGDGNGTDLSYNGQNYYTLSHYSSAMNIAMSTISPGSVSFGADGTADSGSVMEFTVVPEPATWVSMLGGLGLLAAGRRFRRTGNQ